MSSEWETVLLGELCNFTKGTSPTQKTLPGDYPLIVTGPEPLSSADYQFDGEAVCVPMVSSTGHGHASLKRVHYATGKFAVANIVTACEVKKPEQCDTRYLYHYLQQYRNELIVPRMRGTANVSLSQKDLAQVPVTLPSLRSQRRIVDLTDAVEDAVRLASASSAEAKKLYEAGCDSLARGSLVSGPEGLVERLSGDVIAFIGSGRPATLSDEGTIPVYGSNGRVGNALQSNSPVGTIVIGRVGANCGSVQMPESDFWATDNTLCVRAAEGVPPRYLFHLLRGLNLNRHRSGSGQPLITQGVVKNRPISCPSADDMSTSAALLDSIEACIIGLRAEAESLEALRTKILSALLSGAHRIPETYDELMGA